MPVIPPSGPAGDGVTRVDIAGCGNPCDPCQPGSLPPYGSGGGGGQVTPCCPDQPIPDHLNLTVQDLGTTTGLLYGFPTGTYPLQYGVLRGALGVTTFWAWDGTGPLTGVSHCDPSGGTGGESWLLSGPLPSAPATPGDGTVCVETVFGHSGPWLDLTANCATPDGVSFNFGYGLAYAWMQVDNPATGHQSLQVTGVLNPAMTHVTETLVSCSPFLWSADYQNDDGSMHVVVTISE